MRDHKRLQVFRLAEALAVEIYRATQRFPEDERFGLSSQLRRAAVSVGANIAEGATRPSKAEFVRFLTMAYGSAREIEFEVSLAVKLNYVVPTGTVDLTSQTCKALYALIRVLTQTTS